MQPPRHVWTGAIPAALIAMMLTLLPGVAGARSFFDCRDLDAAPVPMFEGLGGTFYRIDPDLMMHNRMSDGTVRRIGALNAALAASGTRLIVVPVPTKALAMPQHLGSRADAYGYDPILAATMYEDTLVRLQKAGVETLNARRALIAAAGDADVFFNTDPRLSGAGLDVLSDALGAKLSGLAAGGSARQLDPVGTVVLPSNDKLFLQMKCAAPLPDITVTALSSTGGGTGAATDAMLVGTEITGEPALNFAGRLAARTGLDPAHFVVPGDPVGALTAALMSDAFASTRPKLLIWEVPIWINLALHGDQPLAEAIAAARANCGGPLPVENIGEGQMRIDLRASAQGSGAALFLDTQTTATAVEVRFAAANGSTRFRTVKRRDGIPGVGQFYIPFSGLWPEGVAYADVKAGSDPETLPNASICQIGATE